MGGRVPGVWFAKIDHYMYDAHTAMGRSATTWCLLVMRPRASSASESQA